MDIIGSSFTQASANPSTSDTVKSAFEGTADLYLGLFLTTLKNQDPTKPYEVEKMTESLSQLNTSQQQIQMNENLETLISQNNNSQIQSYISLIGREVTYEGEDVFYDGQRNITIGFDNKQDLKNATITIKDTDGNLVLTKELSGSELEPTNNKIYWDGANFDGDKAIGYYKVSVTGENVAGEDIDVSTSVTGTVGAIDFRAGEPILSVGFDKDYKIDVPFGNIATVSL